MDRVGHCWGGVHPDRGAVVVNKTEHQRHLEQIDQIIQREVNYVARRGIVLSLALGALMGLLLVIVNQWDKIVAG